MNRKVSHVAPMAKISAVLALLNVEIHRMNVVIAIVVMIVRPYDESIELRMREGTRTKTIA